MDKSLIEHYNQLYVEAIQKIKSGNYETDKLIDSPSDDRFGITLLFRFNEDIKLNIQSFINKLKYAEPRQYYYPKSDLHVTVMSIIGCYSGFHLSQIDIDEYVKLINQSIQGLQKFEIMFKGLTVSSTCIMARGFPADATLNKIRENLRNYFKKSGLEQSMDKRYFIQSAHSTIMRFKEKFVNVKGFMSLIEENKDLFFGKTNISSMELVFNDWYQRDKNVKKLHEFYI